MEDSQSSAATVDHDEHRATTKIDLSHLPPIYVLAAHLSINEQHEAEDSLSSGGAPLTYDIKEANIVLGNISRARRAKSELQWKGVRVEDLDEEKKGQVLRSRHPTPAKKKRRLTNGHKEGSQRALEATTANPSADSETEDDDEANTKPMSQLSLSRVSSSSTVGSPDSSDTKEASPDLLVESIINKVRVVRLEWLTDSLSASKAVQLEPYIIYEGRLLPNNVFAAKPRPPMKTVGMKPYPASNKRLHTKERIPQDILERANADPKPSTNRYKKYDRIKAAANQDIVGKSFSSSTQSRSQPITRPTHLLHQTTSEHDEAVSSTLPSMPNWVRENKVYACERATPLKSPNQDFICELKKIKLARLLRLDEIGVRAYSTSIASLAAYPYPLQNTREILALPGCDQKIAHLFHEYQTTGRLLAVEDLEADPALKVLREFYEIWGVGAKTAREFYYDKGLRDLDDIIEHGWKSLSRVQQIGLKYYDEFLLKIPRSEVESITATIAHYAKLVTDANVEMIIVGGYRRGKAESGDVDVILSHQEPAMTYNLVDRVVRSLEKEGWITHTLTMNLTNTKRNQEPLPINTATIGGHGFDTLDKALVVWQDPNWPTKTADLAAHPKAKNSNTHRRVDIIISPWRTVGCAIAGWTSGTTFQRDLRRYAKHRKGWKFDSSGVRERGTGRWVDLEGWVDEKTRCRDWKEAERKVFEGMGLVYRAPWDRCTG